ncbi:radical SAM protein [Asanoa ishikariensis]|uniref:Anaerobic ribonucleoside-triphosphate reductase activating protein n=1 Tax=Asanoa ishikariensis TaxID=137265 RepID=A0A1H3UH97_9ACTN|nr:4Fe-4S single cluster domain-containing protein [Asanoa ishikariensis]GIF63516.1 radical SAM protein [Asanoa ishikariensis]SDZ61833.1 anaerobic ribonucleoside-triphosphate reductase activating protein [Asanoa ishikariensis]
MSEPAVTVARYLGTTTAEGPGVRTAVWVQGCTIRCAGCFNPHLFAVEGGVPWSPAELAARVLSEPSGGLTLLGGEPFDQAEGLAAVASQVRAGGRSVLTFSGYTHASLRRAAAAGRPGVAGLLAATDLLIAGPFQRDRIDHERPWAGSTNQEFVVLGDRFPDLVHWREGAVDRLQVDVDRSGTVAVNGWLDTDRLDALLAALD